MSATRSAIGVVALWATFCVVLLAAGWLNGRAGAGVAAVSGVASAVLDQAVADAGAPLKAPAAPESPLAEAPAAAESGADPETSAREVNLRLRRTAWVAVVPLWPADALRWQRPEPALRLNPGHAPPHA